MSRTRRMTISVVVLACLMCVAALANAQTRRLTIHVNNAGASGVVRVITGAVGACFLNAQCTYDVNAGATVRLAADYPGRLSGGTGPAAACALSTCSFTMTADAGVRRSQPATAPRRR